MYDLFIQIFIRTFSQPSVTIKGGETKLNCVRSEWYDRSQMSTVSCVINIEQLTSWHTFHSAHNKSWDRETERLLESRALGHNIRGSSSVMVDDRQPRSRKPTMVGGLTHWTVEDRSPRFCQPPSKSFSYNGVVSLPYPLWWEFIESSHIELGFGTAYCSLQIT